MAQNKTTETGKSVMEFLNSVSDDTKRNDCFELVNMIQELTQLEAKMWGPSIVGFGSHHYRYESGREGDGPNFAFSPRASSIALYFHANFDHRAALLSQFGKHKTDKGCVHIKKLADVDKDILKKMVENQIKHVNDLYPTM